MKLQNITPAFARLLPLILLLMLPPLLRPDPATAQAEGRALEARPEVKAPADAPPEVLVLGVWHMANVTEEGKDILSSGRQAQLGAVMSVLERFRPTKVALEAAFYRQDNLADRYQRYLAGGHELARNERQQLGFRLARRLGHETVYAIDADGDFPLLRLQDYVEANGREEAYEARQASFAEWVGEWDEYFASHTLLDALLHMNSDAYADRLMTHDYALAHFGEPWNWAGPDLATAWFRRNLRIYGNVVHLADSPGERVLVIIGAGHLPWLRHNFGWDPGIRLRTLEEFVGEAGG